MIASRGLVKDASQIRLRVSHGFARAYAALVVLAFPAATWAGEGLISYNRDIRPILSNNCFYCHGHDESHREADLRLDIGSEAHRDRDGVTAFKPHDLDGSEAWARITSADEAIRMPPPDSKRILSKEQIELLRRWIADGARYEGHWSFKPPSSPTVPKISGVHNPIDAFILKQLKLAALPPAPEAEREVLIRRVTMDLTGLPPAISEIDSFLADQDEDAYEKVVDRLLASPHYAERMALAWLDAARYADSSGLHADGERDMWGWRDWVIQAFNANMPFDQFTVEQLAGDLVPNATDAQRIASAFNRNHVTSDEFGAVDEELRFEYVLDRVHTTSSVWLGLSMECAQCHDHKFDPITQRDYYRFFAFFNQTTDAGLQSRFGNSGAVAKVFEPESKRKVMALERAIAQLEQQLSERRRLHAIAFESSQGERKASTANVASHLIPTVFFSLDDAVQGAVEDVFTKDRRGEIEGEIHSVQGIVAGALRFDGAGSVNLGNAASFESSRAFSISLWVKPDASLSGALIARLDENADYRGFDLALQDGLLCVDLIHRWPDNAIVASTQHRLKPNQWQHIVVTYDGSSMATGVNIFIDGVAQPLRYDRDALDGSIAVTVPLRLGRRQMQMAFKGDIDDVRYFDRTLSFEEIAEIPSVLWEYLSEQSSSSLSSSQAESLFDHFCKTHDDVYRNISKELEKEKFKHEELSQPLTTVMVMEEMETPRATYVYDRGNYSSPIKEQLVAPGVPEALPQISKAGIANRLDLANWIVDKDNPLTARVTINRYWQMLFGTGLVSTAGDLGMQGEWPSNPELLDWLAIDFQEHNWDVKRALKQMVMSKTYRQSAAVRADSAVKDPENRLLSRGPRFRLQAEFIRDQALFLSGLLSRELGGPSVKPYQPVGLWEEVALIESPKYVQDHGSSLYRRSMYSYWKRSALLPNMQAFDAPARERCTLMRQRTNTPLQALVTLNDPQFVEAARAFAERIIKEGGNSTEDRIRFAYRCATSRYPGDKVISNLKMSLELSQQIFEVDTESALQLLGIGETLRDEDLTPAEHAAWTVVASVILNLDEVLTRG